MRSRENDTGRLFQIVTAAPQKFKIEILPVDDGTPRIVTNLGLQWLEYMDNKVRRGSKPSFHTPSLVGIHACTEKPFLKP